jgi:hypothetical protein
MKTKKITGLMAVLVLALTSVIRAELTITASAANTVSMALLSGAVLPGSSSRVELGYYSGSVNRALFESYTSASSFTTGWTSIATGTSNWSGYEGLFSVDTLLVTGNNTLLGKQLFVLVGNATSIATSTEITVMTNTSWLVPTNPTGDIPEAWGFDILDVTAQQSGILFGTYNAGGGAYPGEGVVDAVRLQTVVPEPSTGALMMIGAAGLVALRRLRKV